MSFEALLDSFVTIKHPTVTRDNLGGEGSTTWAILYTRVPCRFESKTEKLGAIAYDKDAVFPDYFVYLEWRSGIKEGDRIYLGSREFEIKLIENWSEQEKYMMLAVVELGRNE